MSEYNANTKSDECGVESIHDDDEDILDDLNNLDDNEVRILIEIKID
jgi:hypothetical protein